MKRRDFMKTAAVSTLGAGMVSAQGGIQSGQDKCTVGIFTKPVGHKNRA